MGGRGGCTRRLGGWRRRLRERNTGGREYEEGWTVVERRIRREMSKGECGVRGGKIIMEGFLMR